MDIYIKMAKKVSIAGKTEVKIQDIAEVVSTNAVSTLIKQLVILNPKPKQSQNYIVSIVDLIRTIQNEIPESTINNVGEMETLIDYKPQKSKDNKYIKWAKIAFVSLVLFAGSSTAIMSFHSDAEIAKLFNNFYYIFFGEKKDNPMIFTIPYSIGLASGIILFFNHLWGKKITDDPTPLEVEMSSYETSVSDTLIDILNTNRIREKESSNDGNS